MARRRPLGVSVLLGACAALSVACTAEISGSVGDDAPGPTMGSAGTTNGTSGYKPGEALPPATGRRLTSTEYVRTVSNLFEQDFSVARGLLPEDAAPNGFRNDAAALLPSAARTFAIEEAAWAIATEVPFATLQRWASCVEMTATCQQGFAQGLGRLLFRRPVTSAEVTHWSGLFAVAAGEGEGFEAGARLVVAGMLQSPYFQFRPERVNGKTDAQGHRLVDDYELATRLSFMLWGSAPDAALLDRVQQGALAAADTTPVVEQMLKSPQARPGLAAFVEDWLSLYRLDTMNRDSEEFPELVPTLPPLMKGEVQALFARLSFEEPGDLRRLFTDTKSAVNPQLAALYGMSAGAPPSAGGLVDLSSVPTRGGLLAMPGLIAAQSSDDEGSLVERGLFVLRALMCRNVPPPPPGVATNLDAVPVELPQRERFELHAKDAVCRGCHAQFDGLGQAFEPYDGLGRRHLMDSYGNAVRGDGEMLLDGASQTFQDLPQFQRLLASSETVRSCIAQRFVQYAYGRELGAEDDGLINSTATTFAEAGNGYLGLARAVATNPLVRQVADVEIAP